MRVTDYLSRGNSFPIIVEKNTKKWLVKLRAGLSGKYSLINEWLGSKIGNAIGINTQEAHWITLDKSLEYQHIHPEVRDLIDKSLGINIGFKFIENTTPFHLKDINDVEEQLKTEIYLFDMFMFNVDRTAKNMNLLVQDTQVLVTDYDSSLMFTELISDSQMTENWQVLQSLKSHPFYQKVSNHELDFFLSKINKVEYEKILSEIPQQLIDKSSRKTILKKIQVRKSEGWKLRQALDKLEETELETEQQKATRLQRNRKRFEEVFLNGQ